MGYSSDEQRRNNLLVGDERTELLETIREIVDKEVDRKLASASHDPHPEIPPPRHGLLKRLFDLLHCCDRGSRAKNSSTNKFDRQ